MTTPQQEQRDPMVAAWDALAAGHSEFTTSVGVALAEQALDRAGVGADTRFLDVAAGTGSLSLPAARRGAGVLATDLSPAMIEHLAARAREEGLGSLDTAVMDALALDLPDDSFDVAGSQHGVSILPDVATGISELARVTRPGGRVLLVAFGPVEQAEFLGMYVAAIAACVPGFGGIPLDTPPPPFQLADPTVLRTRMEEVGLRDVVVEPVTWEMEFRSGHHMWDCVRHSNPIGAALVADLDDEQRGQIQRVLDGMLKDRGHGSLPAVVRTAVNIAVGTA